LPNGEKMKKKKNKGKGTSPKRGKGGGKRDEPSEQNLKTGGRGKYAATEGGKPQWII